METLMYLVTTLVVLGIIYLLMLVIFNAVAIYYLIKYWPYIAYGWKKLKEQVDEEMRADKLKEKYEAGSRKFTCLKVTKCEHKLSNNKCDLPFGEDCRFQSPSGDGE